MGRRSIKSRGLIWNVDLPWEVNIQAVLDAAAAPKFHTAAVRAKISRARLATVARKRAAAAKRSIERYQVSRARGPRQAPALRHWGRILLAMSPGHWYGEPDLRELTGLSKDDMSGALRATLYRRGMVEKARNAELPALQVPERVAIVKGGARFLWRLSPAGERERELLELL